MKELIEKIVEKEWLMFSATQNIGGTASCQQRPDQFAIMRSSQFSAWNAESLESYLRDIEKAEKAGENLVTLKYAYMMESTDPASYAAIAHKLPQVEAEKKALVEELTALTLAWCKDFAKRYPHVAAAGRPIESSADALYVTSVETYSRGEFSSYSAETLTLLLAHYKALAAEGINVHEKVVGEEMRLVGAESLEIAESILSRR